jgi:hypothetical protein
MSTIYAGPTLTCYVCGRQTKDHRDICSSLCASRDTRPGVKEVRLYAEDERSVRQYRSDLEIMRGSLVDLYFRYEEELDEVDMALAHIEDAMRELDALLVSGLSLMPDRGNRQLPLGVS